MKSRFTVNYLLVILLFLLTRTVHAQQPTTSCGTNDSLAAAYLEKISRQTDLATARANVGEMLEYRLAIDVDYKTANLYGQDHARIRDRVYSIFAETSAIFEREMNIKLTVNYIHIWQQPEPYELNGDYDYFNNILDYWNRNRHEERDAVVSLSARYGTFLGGYRMCSSNFPGPDDRFVVDILAHELGHTLGSPHTHNCSWPGGPIDRCSGVEGTSDQCPVSRLENLNGSIMSYCRAKLTFHPLCRALIRQYAEGAVNPSFSLNLYNEKPVRPGLITVLGSQGSNTGFMPSFEWYPSLRTKKYRFQIAADEAFSRIVEDTTVNQSYFRSHGINEGSYFARYQPENDLGNSGWSVAVGFNVAAFSESAAPPQLLRVMRGNLGVVSGSFKALDGISAYQLRIEVPFQNQSYETTAQITGTGFQNFTVSHGLGDNSMFSLQYRISKQGIWSQWSAPIWLETPVSTLHSATDSTRILSSKPILAVRQWVPLITNEAFTGQAQIATDPSFQKTVFEGPFSNNALGAPYTDKELFRPSLNEQTTYFIRSRLALSNQVTSAWNVSKFATGVDDTRFSFVETASKGLQTSTFSLTLALSNRFVKAGDQLYIFNFQGGYHSTTDLLSWENFIPSKTNGQSPQILAAFGASPDGKVFAADPYQGFMLKTGHKYEWISPPTNISWNDTETMLYSETSGFFLRSYDKGIVQFHNGTFTYHRAAMQLGTPFCLGKDNQERIWTVGDGGAVWRFENNQWTNQTHFPFRTDGIYGMTFDKSDNCYIYGDFGVGKLNSAAGRWDLIEPLQKFNVRKVIFDADDNMWLASYFINYDKNSLENYALVKFANGKANVYSDGLNFLREPFDIVYFNDKLCIMTTGGEIQTFDERQILDFEPEATYPAGSPITVKLSTNSTFGADNRITILLNNQITGAQISVDSVTIAGHAVSFTLPDTLSGDQYTINLLTTSPEITSNESLPFRVVPNDSPINEHPNEVVLLQNSPNPALGPTEIAFYLPQAAEARLELFNLRGQFMKQLGNKAFAGGWNFVQPDLSGLQSGVYVYRLTTGNVVKSLKMIR